MTMSRRIPLNPCDNCIYGHHRHLARAQGGENIAFMMADLAGGVEPSVVRGALADAMCAYPALMSSLRTSVFRVRPYWKLPLSPSDAASRAVERAYVYDDLRSFDDWAARLDLLCTERYSAPWDVAKGPPVRLEHYVLPGEQTRLCLRWPHFLMDAEGAQWFFSQMERQRRNGAAGPVPNSTLLPDDQPVDVLSKLSRVERLRLMVRGLSEQQSHPRGDVRHLKAADPVRFESYRVLHRHWQGADVERIRENARRIGPPGPALYARHLATAVVRALDRIYRDEKVETGVFLITFPLRVRRPHQADEANFRRPLIGNYLVTPTLAVPRGHSADAAVIGEELLRQIQAFHSRQGDAAQWAMLEAMSHVHAWIYPLIFRIPFAGGSYSSGFSYYGEIDSPLRSFAGAKVINLWGGGPTTTPPGWNPVFSRYGDRLNMSLTWTRPAITDELAARYATYIEEFLFAAT